MLRQGKTFKEAYDMVLKARPSMSINNGFINQLERLGESTSFSETVAMQTSEEKEETEIENEAMNSLRRSSRSTRKLNVKYEDGHLEQELKSPKKKKNHIPNKLYLRSPNKNPIPSSLNLPVSIMPSPNNQIELHVTQNNIDQVKDTSTELQDITSCMMDVEVGPPPEKRKREDEMMSKGYGKGKLVPSPKKKKIVKPTQKSLLTFFTKSIIE